jgi:CHAT domain-containing protein/tetratricopeptide (TPR) repeat protein
MSAMMGLPAVLLLACLPFYGGIQQEDRKESREDLHRFFLQVADHRSHGDFEAAVSSLKQAISGQAHLTDGDRGQCLIQLGILSWDLGEISESTRYFRDAEGAFERSGDLISRGRCEKYLKIVQLYDQGKADRLARLFYRSILRFEQAISLGGEVGVPDLQLKCLRQQSLAYLDLRKLDLYLENNRKGLDIATKINHRVEQGRCLNNIGVYYLQRHSFSQAVGHLEKALSISRTVDEEQTQAECLNNLSLVYRELGNLGLAQYYISQALTLDEKAGHVTAICMDLENFGSILLRKGIEGHRPQDLRLALEMFQKCLLMIDQAGGDPLAEFAALNNLGIILNELKKHDDARGHLTRAMNILKAGQYALERGQVHNNIGATYLAERRANEAIVHYSQAVEIGLKNSFDNVLMEGCLGLGRCYDLKNDDDRALPHYRRSIDALERLRAEISSEPFMIGFARNKFGGYERAIDILADRHERQPDDEVATEIFTLIERAKARAFLESVYEARIEIAESDVAALKERQRAVSGNISLLNSRLAGRLGSKEDEQDLRDELELEEDEYRRIVSDIRDRGAAREERWQKTVSGVRDIQRILGADESVLLEYFLGQQQSYLIVISPQDLKVHVLPAKAQIETSLRGYLKWVSDPASDPTSGSGPSERIERQLIPSGPEETVLKANGVVVVPDGILHYLPFESLKVPDETGAKYLIEHMAVSYCPSASALALLMSSGAPAYWNKELLAIGGANYQGKDRREPPPPSRKDSVGEEGIRPSPLPFSRKEVLDIAGLFPPHSADVLAGAEAKEGRIKGMALRDYRRIHFACHGTLDEQNPARSALVLSPENSAEDDGFLQMREIYGLSMNAEMVVLSACQTAGGVLERSEGPMGLARPFFFAGARSVIASLWQVNDKATVVFMRELYRNLAGGRSERDALRSAKIKMLKSSWRHPFYWAGFLLQGDPSGFEAVK